jgi:hypothetical protein
MPRCSCCRRRCCSTARRSPARRMGLWNRITGRADRNEFVKEALVRVRAVVVGKVPGNRAASS